MAAITPTTEITIPAKTADKYWLKRLNVYAPSLNEPVNATIELVPFNSSTGEMFTDRNVMFSVDDLLAKATEQTELAAVLDALFSEVDRQAKLQGLI